MGQFDDLFLYCNFCRVHQALRVTPSKEAGFAATSWTIEDMVRPVEPKPILDGMFRAA
jgi:hypothetical protein